MSEDVDTASLSSGGQSQQQRSSITKKTKKTSGKNKCKIILNTSDCQYPVVSRVAKSLGWKTQAGAQATDWDVFWTDNAVQPQILLKMQPFQKINHFPGMFNLARKNLMGRYLMKMRKKFSEDYSFFPMTWMLPVEYHELKTYFQTKPKGKARTFIVKPEALSQGKGIFLTRKLQEIDQTAHCVVQRYMHRPYLIQGLKFDMRVYVLVASVDPLRLYIYYEGLTRFATEKYEQPTKDNMDDVCMHLTNYAINKDNPKFVFNSSSTDMSKGHKRSLTWLFQYLQKNEPNGAGLKQKIQDMIVKTMISGLPVITNTYRSCQPQNFASNMCFQLLGFDVMLTDKCQPVLLEINHTPSFTTDTPLDDVIKTNYIRDALVLMNINQKTKDNIIKQRRQACQQRVITGKKMKLTNQEKDLQRKKAHMQRDKYEKKHIGGFKRIFPLDDQTQMDKYQQFLNYSQQLYLISTGTKRSSTMVKKGQKIQSAFGTCFKPKETPKNSNSIKNKQDIIKKVNQRKYETKKIIQRSSIQNQKKNMTHSQNLISPKSIGQTEQYYELKLAKGISDGNQNQSQDGFIEEEQAQQPGNQIQYNNHHKQKSFQQIKSKTKFIANQIFNKKSSEYVQTHSCSHLLTAKQQIPKSSDVQIIQQQTQQSNRADFFNKKQQTIGTMSCGIAKVDDSKTKKIKFSSNIRQQSAPKQRQFNTKNLNNVEIFFDSDAFPSNCGIKRPQQQNLISVNQDGKKNDQLKLGIFGKNQITSAQKQHKKYKAPMGLGNQKNVANIQNWDSRAKQYHLSNRQKIPILLNTLLIGNSQGNKPAVSANNLRKILNNQTK